MNKSEFSTISCAISKLCIKTDRLISFTREKRWENRKKAVGRKVGTWMRAKGAEMGEGEGEEGGMKGERGGREWDHEKRGEGKGVRTPLGG